MNFNFNIAKFVCLIWCFVIFPITEQELYAATTAATFPGTTGTNTSIGTVDWNNTAFITASDNSRATSASSLGLGVISYYLTGTNFGFAIPAGSTIDGITVIIEKQEGGGTGDIKDNSVKLIKGGVISGDEKADGAATWSNSDNPTTYGGAAILWGLAWTDADINAPDFGVAISAVGNHATAKTPAIDGITITIDYTPPPESRYLVANGDWSDGVNTWSSFSGGPPGSSVPTVDMDVFLEGGFTVTLDIDGSCKSLSIGTGTAGTLAFTTPARTLTANSVTIASNGDVTGTSNGIITTSGNVTINKNPITSTSAAITMTGASTTISGTGGCGKLAINNTVSNTGTITVSGTLSGSSTLTNTATGTLILTAGTVSITAIICTAVGNTVEYGSNGGGTFNITAITAAYHHLTISGTQSKIFSAALDVNGILTISGTLNQNTNDQNINIAGNWVNNGTFTPSNIAGIENIFDGTTTISGVSTTTFNKVTITGTLIAPAGNFNVNDAWVSSAGTFTHSSGTVTFTGSTADQNITNSSTTPFYNLILNNTAVAGSDDIIPLADLYIANNLTITNGDLDITTSAFDIYVGGDWINSGTGGSFTHSNTNKVVFNGTDARIDQTIQSNGNTFYNLEINNTNSTAGNDDILLSGAISVNNTISIADGDFNGNAAVTCNGNFTVSGGTYSHNNGTITFNGTAAQTITAGSGNPFYDVVLNNSKASNAFSLGGVMVVNNSLTFTDGHIITTSANILNISNGATISGYGDSSFVKGPLIHNVATGVPVTRIFPVGYGNIFRRADLSVDQVDATATEYKCELKSGDANSIGYTLSGTINRVSAIRYHDLTKSPADVVTAADFTIYYRCAGTSDAVTDEANLAIAKSNSVTSNWDDLSGTVTSSGVCVSPPSDYAGYIQSGVFTTFSRFALANKNAGSNPLPVNLVYFNAKLKGFAVIAEWTTWSEENNDFFTVEKSRNGTDFENVTYIKGNGTTSMAHSYSAIDDNPYTGVSYYRLKQTDYDGKFTYSQLVAVEMNSNNGETKFTVYPNPAFGNDVNFSFTGFGGGREVLVVVINPFGQTLYSKVLITDDDGIAITAIDRYNRLPQGIYLVSGSSDERIFSRKLVVK